MSVVFEDVFGHRLQLDTAHQQHILEVHPEIEPFLNRLAERGVPKTGMD